MVELVRLFKKDQGKTASAAREIVELIHCLKKTEAKQLVWQGFCPPIRRDDLCLVFYINPSSMIYTLLKLKANPLVIYCRAFCPKTKAGSCKENDTAELLSAVLRITVGGGFLCAVYVHTLQYTYNVHTVYVYCI